jgi:hypothetical protein
VHLALHYGLIAVRRGRRAVRRARVRLAPLAGHLAQAGVSGSRAAGRLSGRAAHAAISLLLDIILFPLRLLDRATSHPLLRMFVSEVHAVAFRAGAYVCALAVMGLIAAEAITRHQGPAVAVAPAPEWIESGKPFPAFAMTMPELDAAPRYAIWRHPDGGGRKDILTFGDPASGGATAVVELYRPGAEPDAEADIVTASIPDLRLSGRPVMQTTIATKFGDVAIDGFTDPAPAGNRNCLRFWRTFEEPKLEIGGWFCNAGEAMVDRGMIACALDRLTLIAAASEPKIGALFAQAELKRSFCGTNSVFIAATHKRVDWIGAARDPKLRGRQ